MYTFAKNARFLRVVNGYTQEEISRHLHISRSSYLRLETGQVPATLDQIYVLSCFYGIELQRLVSYDIAENLLSLLNIESKHAPPISLNIVKNNIKLLRQVKHLSQEHVAFAIHLSRATYSAYETGSLVPDVHTLILLSALFEVDVNTLISHNLCEETHLFSFDNST